MSARFKIVPLFVILLATISFASINAVSLVDDTVFNTGGKMIIIDWSSMYSDSITASQSASQIKTATGAEVDRGFALSMTSGDEYATYSLTYLKQLNYVKIMESDWKTFGWSDADIKTWVNGACLDLDGDGGRAYSIEWLLGMKIQIDCFGRDSIAGDVYTISTPKSIFNTNIIFQADGKDAKTVTLSNDNNVADGKSTSFGSDVIIRWKGSFSTGNIPPIASNLYLTKTSSSINNIADAYRLTEYQTMASQDGNDLIVKYVNSQIDKAYAQSQINNKINALMNTWASSPEFPSSKVSFPSANIMKIDLTESVFIPSFQILVNGVNYIKVIIPSGEPQVTGVSLPTLSSDYEGNAIVNVKNIGTQTGDFIVSLSCDNVAVFSNNQVVSVRPSSTGSITFRLTGSVNTQSQYTCTATAKDSISQKTATASATGTIKPRPKCNTGEEICRQESTIWKIYGCDGNDFTTLKGSCNPSETCEKNTAGQYYCKKPDSYVCNADVDCDDKNSCTTDKCESGLFGKKCVNTAIPNCTGGDLTFAYIIAIIVIIGIFAVLLKGKKRKRR